MSDILKLPIIVALPVGELKVIRFTSPQMSYEKSNDENTSILVFKKLIELIN